jgi:hypothetical protein
VEPILKIKEFVLGEDYPEICEWWRARDFTYLPPRLLSPSGIVIFDADGIKYAAGWLFFIKEAGWALLEFLVTNPDTPARKNHEAIQLLARTAREMARAGGVELVVHFTKAKGLAKALERSGFQRGEERMIELYARMEP